VVNAATGGIVTFKASGQTGVSIAVGETAFVYFNGTDYVKVVGTATAGAAGGSNTQVQFNSSGVLAGDADLTFDGTTLSTAGLTASGTVTLSGGTANGVAYLNGSKVVTSGSALTFDGTDLATTGNIILNNSKYYYGKSSGGSNVRLLGINSGDVLYLGIDSGPTSMIVNASSTSTNVAFNASNSEGMRLTSTGLGIGTSSPGTKLDVVGAIRASVASGNSAININNSSLTGKAWDLLPSTSSGESDLLWYYGGTNAGTRMTLTNSGNLGLGVTPSAWISSYRTFSIGDSGFISSRTGASINNLESGVNWFRNSGGSFVYKANGFATNYGQQDGQHLWYNAPNNTSGAGAALTLTQAMTLDASGAWLLGTTTLPSGRKFIIEGSGDTVGRMNSGGASSGLSLEFANNGTLRGGIGNGSGNITSGNAADMAIQANANLVFATGGYGEKMRLDSSGNLGLGVTPVASWSSGGQLQLADNKAIVSSGAYLNLGTNWYYDGGFRYISSTTATNYEQNLGSHRWFTAASGTAGNVFTFTQAMTLNASNQLGVGTTAPSAIIHSASSGLGDGGGIKIQNTGSGGATYSIWPTATVNGEGAGKLIISGPSGNVVTVTTGGFVGVGTTSPAGRLHVDGINGPLRISGSGYATNPVEFTLGLYTSTRAYMQLPGSGSSSGSIEIWNGGTTPISIFNNYGIGLTATPTSGMGIMFPATQSASSDANTLDDYEEGAWTPTNAANITINSIVYAVYTKIGRTVTANCWIKVDLTSSSFELGGLPFASGGRTTASISNVSQVETITNQLVTSTIFGYGATATGTDDDFFVSITYQV
jgi:hypothetical protein